MDNFSPNFFSIPLTLGRDGKYYFCFILPDRLVHQALAIAQKVDRTILKPKGRKGLVEKKTITK